MSTLCWYMVFLLCWLSIFGQGPPSDGRGGGGAGGGGGGGADDNCVCLLENQIHCESAECVEYLDLTNLTVVKVDESTTIVTGIIIFKKVLEDPTKVAVVIEKCDGSGCQVVLNHEIRNLCDEIDNEKSQYHPQLVNILFPPCPIPPGEIVFDGVSMDMSKMPVNKNNQGRYKAYLKIITTNANGQYITLAVVKFGFEIDCE